MTDKPKFDAGKIADMAQKIAAMEDILVSLRGRVDCNWPTTAK